MNTVKTQLDSQTSVPIILFIYLFFFFFLGGGGGGGGVRGELPKLLPFEASGINYNVSFLLWYR